MELRAKDLDFNDLFILECFYYKDDRGLFDMFTIPSMKDFNLSTRYQFLKKNEYLVPDPQDSTKVKLSLKGQDLIDGLLHPEPLENARVVVIENKKTPEQCFEEWWKAYPTSPAWESDDGSSVFTGSRTLKNLTKAKAKVKYLAMLNQGLIHEELLGSLKYEIKSKKLDSIKKNLNQMEYFKGMESYLNQERYLMYIDMYRANPEYVKDENKVKSRKKNVTDI